ncbi:hypothetical protein LCGC14_2329350 [marine sediment metagenome]|uniref:Uncharacterized protein n=1 Tax=marine sediment metagenome TaxID=412755 RepID=A0A0F9ET04_9ZZZZ
MSEVAFYVAGDFPCSIWKHDSLGHLCGYIGVPKLHPWHGLNYDDIPADVHGGLTHTGSEKVLLKPKWIDGHKEYEEIIRDNAFPHDTGGDTWWMGFDCAHLGDLVPGSPSPGDVYRDEDYVRGEIESLVRQAAAAYNGRGDS